jgi:O-antigen/teichoic acid export membrane protein
MNVAQVTTGFLVSIILARALGPEGRGEYALLILVTGTLAMIMNPAIYASANYFMSTKKWKSNEAFWTVLISSSGLGLLAGIACVSVASIIKIETGQNGFFVLALAVLTAIIVVSSSINGLFYGSGNIHTITNWKTLYSITQLIVFFLVAYYTTSVYIFFIAFTLMSAVDLIVMLVKFSLRADISFTFQITLFRQLFRYGFPVYGSRILLFIGQRLDTYLVYFFLGTVSLGYYTIAVTFAEQLWILPLSVSMIMMPNLGSRETDDAAILTTKIVRIASIFVVLGSLVLALFTPFAFPMLYGNEYDPVILPLLCLLPGTATIGLFSIAEPFFQSRGRPKIPLAITAIGICMNLAMDLILIPVFGTVGAASASTIAYVLQFAVTVLLFKKMTGISARQLLGMDIAIAELWDSIQRTGILMHRRS